MNINKLFLCLTDSEQFNPLNSTTDYMFVTKTETVLTERYIIIILYSEVLFSPEFRDKLPDSGILIERKFVKMLNKNNTKKLDIDPITKTISIPDKDFFKVFLYKENNEHLKFPDYTKLKDYPAKKIDTIVMAPQKLAVLFNIFNDIFSHSVIKFYFAGKDKHIKFYVSDCEAFKSGFIMPCMDFDA